MKIGVDLRRCPGVGDVIQFSSLPFNFLKNTGEKLIDVNNHWVYDYNPYVIRGEKPDKVIDLWENQHNLNVRELRGEVKNSMYGMAARVAESFNLKEVYLRHNCLYKYEELETQKDLVVVHTNGKSEGGAMTDGFVEQIRKNYASYRVVQIGGKTDRDTGFEDKRGLPIWETAEIIAQAATFIGVNSGMMHVADAYPKVRKKILVNQYNEEQLKWFRPSDHPRFTAWIPWNAELFNLTNRDIGVTMSAEKI